MSKQNIKKRQKEQKVPITISYSVIMSIKLIWKEGKPMVLDYFWQKPVLACKADNQEQLFDSNT